MASITDICNQALGRLGAETITGLDDASPSARFCNVYYTQTRDEVLRAHPWNFAIKRQTLTSSGAADSGWSYKYTIPNDCLRVLQLNGFEDYEARDKFGIEARYLVTDEDTANIKYIARIEDVNLYDPVFIEALAVKLASKLATCLSGSRNAGADFLSEYERITGPSARRLNAFEGRPKQKEPWVESSFVRSRWGGA
jgi:hypothetical protein